MDSKKELAPIIVHTQIENMRISSVLDRGFMEDFEVSPEAHAHTFFELLFSLEGELRIELLNGEQLVIPQKNFCLIPPMLYHSTHRSSGSEKKLALCFRVERDETISNSTFYELCTGWLGVTKTPPLLFECEELYLTLRDFKREFNSSMLASEACASALLLRCYVLLFRVLCSHLGNNTICDASQKSQDLSVSRRVSIEEYLYHHSNETITQDDMARTLHISARQLNRILQQLYGASFRQLLIDTRLHKAAQLLTKTDCAIEDIAAEVGYTSLSGFYSAFRSKFGISAGKYRKQTQPADIQY